MSVVLCQKPLNVKRTSVTVRREFEQDREQKIQKFRAEVERKADEEFASRKEPKKKWTLRCDWPLFSLYDLAVF